MTEIALLDICEQILSEKPKIKLDGLRNLRFILSNYKNLQFIGEKCYQRLLESLIKAVTYEKHNNVERVKLNNTSMFSRLQECGAALRTIIEFGNKFLKTKTFFFVLNHIVDTLSITEGIVYQAISVDYIKCLKSILSHPPHVEHLNVCEWEKLIIFCYSFISNLHNDHTFSDINVSSNNIESSSGYNRSSKQKQRLKYESIELMYCLQILVSWSAAPLTNCLFKLTDFLLNFLSFYSSETNAHLSAFMTLNSLMQRISINNLEISSRVAHDMIRICIKLWGTKSFLLKNQLIIGLTLACPHWYKEFGGSYQNVLETDLVRLFHCIQIDYTSQNDTEALSIDDIILHSPVSEKNASSFFCFSSSLRCLDLFQVTKKSEQSFFILQIAAYIIQIFQSKRFDLEEHIYESNVSECSKMHRIFSFFEKNGDDLYRLSNSTKIFWLQTMVFFFERSGKYYDDFSSVLTYFISLFSDNDTTVQTWALLGVGSFVCWKSFYYQMSTSISDVLENVDIFHLCLRKSAVSATCRSACHVISLLLELNLVNTTMMSSVFRHIFDSIEINGPAILSGDSYRFLLLLFSLLEQNNCLVGVNGSLCLLHWFLSRWNSMDFLKRSSICHFSNFPIHTVEFLINCCLNSGFIIGNRRNNQFDSIGLFSLKQKSSNDVLSYLLMHEVNISYEQEFCDELKIVRNKSVFFQSKFVLEKVAFIVLSMQNTIKAVLDRWTQLLKKLTHVHVDVFRSFVQFSFVIILFTRFILIVGENIREFLENSLNLIKELVKFLTSENCSREQVDIVLYCLNRIPSLKFDISCIERDVANVDKTMLNLFQEEIHILLQTLKQRNSFFQLQDSNRMIMDDDDRSMVYQENLEKGIPLLREYIDARYSVNSVKAGVLLYLEIVLLSNDPLNIFNMSELHLEKTVLFVLLKSQFGDNLIQLGFFLTTYLSYIVDKMTEDDISEILENFAKTYLTQYELDRSDVVMIISIDLLIVTVKKWLITDESSSLRKVSGKIFEWILKVALENHLASFYTRIRMLKLLNAIFQVSKDCNLNLGLLNITPGGIFLQLLRDHDSRILYLAAMMIKFMFEGSNPKEHSKIYFDIVSQLEVNEENSEKIALRALVLSNIIIVSEYVRKAALYNLIELGKFDSISLFVLKCLQWSCKSLSLESELNLFNLYRSQIIWSWLNFEKKLDKFPFKVLNFPSINNFYSSNLDEIIPQLILLGKNKYIIEISNLTQVSLKRKIHDVFHRIVGYTLLFYNEKNIDSVLIFDLFHKDHLGYENFKYLLKAKFPMIVSVLFESMKDEISISKNFLQFDLQQEATNFDEICGFGTFDGFLPEPSRPFYKVKSVLKSIQDLCRYTDISVQKLNDSYIIIYVFRHLMLNCRLGTSPSEKCLHIRKFRVYMCFLDRSLIRGYILQVLLEGLQRYLCFSECFMDVSGMLQYLLMCGYHCHDFSTLKSTIFLNVIMNLIKFGTINTKLYYSSGSFVDKLFLWIIKYCDLIAEMQELSFISSFLKSYYSIVISSDKLLVEKSQNIKIISESLLNNLEIFDKNSALFLLEILQDDSMFLLFENDNFIEIKRILFSICDMSKMSTPLLQYNARILEEKYKDIAFIYTSNLFVSERSQLLENPLMKIDEYYWKDKTISFSEWLRFLLRIILHNFNDDFLFRYLGDLVEYVASFSEKIFIFSVDYLLLNKSIGTSISVIEVLNQIVNFVFSQYDDSFYRPHILLMIEMILYLRSQTSEIHYSGFDLNFRFEINYFDAALAAASCQLWETSLLFICIYWTLNDSIIDDKMLNLLSIVYKEIDDPDLFYGIPYIVSLENILSRHKFEGNGWSSLFLHATALENDYRMLPLINESEHVLGVMEAFNMLGFRSFSRMNLFYSRNNITSSFIKDQYSSSWRLEQWDLPCAPPSSNFDHIIYNILLLINRGAVQNIFSDILNSGYSAMINTESYPFISDKRITGLIMLTEIDEFFSELSFTDVWFRWQSRLSISNPSIKFISIEPILSLRQVLLSSVLKNPSLMKHSVNKSLIQKCLIKTLIELSHVARVNDNLQIAFSAIAYAEKLLKIDLKLNSEFLSSVAIQISRVLWDRGDKANSVKLLCEIANGENVDIFGKYDVSPELFAQLASWTSELRLQRPDFIIEKYFKSAVRMLNNNYYGNEAGYVFYKFGFFCDKQLESHNFREDFERVQKLRKQKSDELAVLDQMIDNASTCDKETLLLHRAKTKALFDIDDVEFNRLIENKEVYLQKSIENYLRCLISCDIYDYNISRCMSLWLSNSQNEGVNQTVSKLVYNIATHKFLILFNQLASRLSENNSRFQFILHKLIKYICVDHPYHSLFHLVSLRYSATKDDKLGLLRKKAVDAVLSELLSPNALGNMLKRFMSLCSAYTDFAIYKMKRKEYGSSKISFSVYPKFSVFLDDIPKYSLPPPTMDISIRNDCNYTDTPVISHYVPYFMLASGISSPKVIECVSSDGRFYKQLVKGGNDNLRQDAIMEQVFQQAHSFLQKNRLTRQRNLGIRTYKVLPLTANTGILEWVLYTLPIQDYLYPAHEKYNPKDWTPIQCRKAIDNVSKKSKEIRCQTYEQVISHFKPVMRHFFMDHYSDPKDWFQKQLNYTRSTAAISILGYILGLGDRHGHNILIDKKSGEIVHIDLGLAFDQGKLLPIPETVPFRLTRDIVDGMGITRTEGVFRRCCEFTLNVLREEAFNIISILEILKYDPLYSWTISPLRARKIQKNEVLVNDIDQNDVNMKENSIDGTEAERALLVVSQKLSKTLSVEAVVNELIHEATNPDNLALLFSGWAAYF
ncbi:hypothetical protein PCK1_002586 [Pneumocystis canis]|nr:hypothetical protein PCK1_002586 [Pneumocystis canis]